MNPLRLLGKDLKNQVEKSTVAAAKADRLELGVLGKSFSIGQKQSTGPTSRVGEAFGFGKSVKLSPLKSQEEMDKPYKDPRTGKVWTGFAGGLAPYSVSHINVFDADGRMIAECRDKETAKIIGNLLNEKSPKPDRLK